MAKKNGFYKCEICGNVVSVLESGKGDLVCCGEEMKLFDEKTASVEGKEKHVPVVQKIEKGFRVSVGSVLHPMTEEHFIELIQVIKDNKVILEKRFYPNDKPVFEFDLDFDYVRSFCNVHGLWKN